MSKMRFETLEPGRKVGGQVLRAPLNAKRVRVLIRRRCSLFVDDADGGDPLAGMEAVFYCLTRTAEELTGMVRNPQSEWDAAVEEFALGLDDGALEEFTALFEEEQETIGDAVAVPVVDDEGKEPAPEMVTPGRNHIGSIASLPPGCGPDFPTGTPKGCPSSSSSGSPTHQDTMAAADMSG